MAKMTQIDGTVVRVKTTTEAESLAAANGFVLGCSVELLVSRTESVVNVERMVSKMVASMGENGTPQPVEELRTVALPVGTRGVVAAIAFSSVRDNEEDFYVMVDFPELHVARVQLREDELKVV